MKAEWLRKTEIKEVLIKEIDLLKKVREFILIVLFYSLPLIWSSTKSICFSYLTS